MRDTEFLNQIEHISDIFTRMVLKTTAADLTENAADEMTMSQFQALKHIAQHGPCTIGQLAKGLATSQPAATMLVDRMAKRGLVDRHPGSTDRRRSEISLTERAVELLAQIEAERADRLAKTMALMSDEQRRQLLESMEQFVAAALHLEQSVDEACLQCGIEHHPSCIVNRAR
ncbi:MAG TPA: MarR family transcriptional regulator, partial [Armatimonadota bacterium]